MVLPPTFFILLMVYRKDFLRFIPYSITALFSGNVSPDPLFAQIALSGSRYAIASGAIGTLIYVINILQGFTPSEIGVGFAVAFLCLFYALIISEFFFISVYNIFSAKNNDVSRRKTKLHFVLSLLIFIIAVALLFLYFGNVLDEKDDECFNRKGVAVNGFDILMPETLVNIGSDGKQIIKFRISFEVSDFSVRKYFLKKACDNPDGMFNKIQSSVIDIFMDKPLESFLGKKSKKALAEELKKKVNYLLERKKASGVVKDVYFQEFLVKP
jgi:flagellar basal body-associated protein FliL